MKEKKIATYLLNIILLIIIIFSKNIVNDKLKVYAQLFIVSFWILLTLFVIYKYGFSRDKNYLKANAIRIVIISIFSYFLITYMLGLLTGFSKTVFKLDIISILRNIIGPLIIIICQEINRYIYARKWQYDVQSYILLTIFYIIINISSEYSVYTFDNMESIFKFFCLSLFPIVARECLCSYLTYKVSYVPTLLIKIVFNISIYILPIFPILGDYLTSIIGILYPTTVYFMVNKTIIQYDKSSKYVANIRKKVLYFPIIAFILILIVFTSGIFRYQLIAIGSGSMEPIYKRGDAIIFKKVKDISKIEKGMIIAFKRNNIIITHRVVDIMNEKNGYSFQTKGDANETEDDYIVLEKDVIGIVVFLLPYIGYPTIWIEEQF